MLYIGDRTGDVRAPTRYLIEVVNRAHRDPLCAIAGHRRQGGNRTWHGRGLGAQAPRALTTAKSWHFTYRYIVEESRQHGRYSGMDFSPSGARRFVGGRNAGNVADRLQAAGFVDDRPVRCLSRARTLPCCGSPNGTIIPTRWATSSSPPSLYAALRAQQDDHLQTTAALSNTRFIATALAQAGACS